MIKMPSYDILQARLINRSHTWLITGVAGFIGSNLLEQLLKLKQRVVGIDNFCTGYQRNLDEVQLNVPREIWSNFHFIEGDIRNLEECREAMTFRNKSNDVTSSVEFVLHQAALGSVPRSLEDPVATNSTNVTGFLNLLVSARDARVRNFVYAASSSTYGDHPGLPKRESTIGSPLSPYAVTKYVNELYAEVFTRSYGINTVGLRYFNVFGKRQDPQGAYAAVIPKWTQAMIDGKEIFINGDGSTSRDFCYIDNAVQANILAAFHDHEEEKSNVFNVAFGERTSLNELFTILRKELRARGISYDKSPMYGAFRRGDVLHSQADISKATKMLGFVPTHTAVNGLKETVDWYLQLQQKQL